MNNIMINYHLLLHSCSNVCNILCGRLLILWFMIHISNVYIFDKRKWEIHFRRFFKHSRKLKCYSNLFVLSRWVTGSRFFEINSLWFVKANDNNYILKIMLHKVCCVQGWFLILRGVLSQTIMYFFFFYKQFLVSVRWIRQVFARSILFSWG